MSAVAKFNQVLGILAKEETTYGTAISLADASDGCTPYIGDGDPPAPEAFDYVFDGNLGRAAGTLAPQKKTTPNGKFRSGQFQCLPKGIGSAYSSSAVIPPREVHRFLKAAGYDATFVTDHWEYTPTAAGSGYTSLTLRQYTQGFQYDQVGVICDFSWESQGLGVPVWSFAWRGLPSVPTDLSLPAVTYLATSVIPPVASGITATIGSFTSNAIVRKVSFKRNRKVDTARVAQTVSGGHAGFVPGGAAPTFDVELERTALVGSPYHTSAGVDAEALMAAATSIAVDFTYGSTTGNTWKHAFAQAQLVKVTPGNDGPLATVMLSFAAHSSTPALNDYEKISFT